MNYTNQHSNRQVLEAHIVHPIFLLQNGIFAIVSVVYKVIGKFAHFSTAYDLYCGTHMLVYKTCTSIVVKD